MQQRISAVLAEVVGCIVQILVVQILLVTSEDKVKQTQARHQKSEWIMAQLEIVNAVAYSHAVIHIRLSYTQHAKYCLCHALM